MNSQSLTKFFLISLISLIFCGCSQYLFDIDENLVQQNHSQPSIAFSQNDQNYHQNPLPKVSISGSPAQFQLFFYKNTPYMAYNLNNAIHLSCFIDSNWQTISTITVGAHHTFKVITNDDLIYLGVLDQASNGISVYQFDGHSWQILGSKNIAYTSLSSFELTIKNHHLYLAFSNSNANSKYCLLKYTDDGWVYLLKNISLSNTADILVDGACVLQKNNAMVFIYNNNKAESNQLVIGSYYQSNTAVLGVYPNLFKNLRNLQAAHNNDQIILVGTLENNQAKYAIFTPDYKHCSSGIIDNIKTISLSNDGHYMAIETLNGDIQIYYIHATGISKVSSLDQGMLSANSITEHQDTPFTVTLIPDALIINQ